MTDSTEQIRARRSTARAALVGRPVTTPEAPPVADALDRLQALVTRDGRLADQTALDALRRELER